MNFIYCFILFSFLIFSSIRVGSCFYNRVKDETANSDDNNRHREFMGNLNKIISQELMKNNSFNDIFEIENDVKGDNNILDIPNNNRNIAGCQYSETENKIIFNNTYNLENTESVVGAKNIDKSENPQINNPPLGKTGLEVNLTKNFNLIYDLLKDEIKEDELIYSLEDEEKRNIRKYDDLIESKNYSCESKKVFYLKKFKGVEITDECIKEIYNGSINPYNVVCDSKKCLSLEWGFFKNDNPYDRIAFKKHPGVYLLKTSVFSRNLVHFLHLNFGKWISNTNFNLKFQKNIEKEEKITTLFAKLKNDIIENSDYKGAEKSIILYSLKEYIEIMLKYNAILGFPSLKFIDGPHLDNIQKTANRVFFLYFHSCLQTDPITFVIKETEKLNCCIEISKVKTLEMLNSLPDFYNFLPNQDFFKDCLDKKDVEEPGDGNDSKNYDVMNPYKSDFFPNFDDLNPVIVVKGLHKGFFERGNGYEGDQKESLYHARVCSVKP